MDNINEQSKQSEEILADDLNSTTEEEISILTEEEEFSIPEDLLLNNPLDEKKPINPNLKKYLQKMSVKLLISILVFAAAFYAMKSENTWKEKVAPAISYILNEQIDFTELKDNTESMMELFYEKLFSKEAG